MNKMQFKENVLLTDKHVLLYNEIQETEQNDNFDKEELEHVKTYFCGKTFSNTSSFNQLRRDSDTVLYLSGNIKELFDNLNLTNIKTVNVIKELSSNYEDIDKYQLISLGEVPINVFNVGVFFRKFFNSGKDYYDSIVKEHEFQSLTMSNKPGTAYRKGIYLTKVEEKEEGIDFKLLRCSTNLAGGTDNFRPTDNEVVTKVNGVAEQFFKEKAELNHVLAQTYHNTTTFDNGKTKEKKAKIAEHSDKTKDMPKNALMAFCSFYKDFYNDKFNKNELQDVEKLGYNYCYRDTSVLTRLRFRLKKEVKDDTLVKNFDITLYPNSVFLMSLYTNRLYTHEIIPPATQIKVIPERMGYVVRCSNTDAIFKDNKTYICKYGKQFELVEPTQEGIEELKELYYKENRTTEMVDYEDKFYFSMNGGDYMKPIV